MPKADSASRAVNRVCDILNAFTEHEPVLTLTEISRRIGLPKSTTYRFIESLESQGLIGSEPNGRGYRLGYQLIHWGILAQISVEIRSEALPVLRSLTDSTGESSILSMRYGNVATWVELIESPHPVRLAMKVGQRLHLHAGASSKVLLAFLPEKEIEDLLQDINLLPLEKNTITELGQLRTEIGQIRAQGYAVSFEETDRGAMGIAAPVYDHSGQLVAGIGIAAPAVRVTRDRVPDLAEQVLQASQRLSRRLGAPIGRG